MATTPGAAPPGASPMQRGGHSHADGSWHEHAHAHSHGSSHSHSHGSSHSHEAHGPAHAEEEEEEDEEEDETPSLWSRLFFGSDQHAHAGGALQEGDEEDGEDRKGIRLLGAHLAAVKLEAEERAYQDQVAIQKLEREKRAQHELLRDALNKVTALQEEVKKLELQNTKKWQIENRDNWLAQLEALKAERSALKRENETLAEQLRKLSSAKTLSPQETDAIATTDSRDVEWLRTNLARALGTLVEEREARAAEKAEMGKALAEAKRASDMYASEAIALKKKLDFELELKFDNAHMDASLRGVGGTAAAAGAAASNASSPLSSSSSSTASLLSTIAEIVAPRLVDDAP